MSSLLSILSLVCNKATSAVRGKRSAVHSLHRVAKAKKLRVLKLAITIEIGVSISQIRGIGSEQLCLLGCDW